MVGVAVTDPRSDKIDAYDTAANTWDTSLTPMPTARAGMAVAAVGDKIYVIGGLLQSGSGNTDIMEVYDTTLDSWSTPPTPLPGPKRHGMGCVSNGEFIYVVGGFNTGQTEMNIAYRYNTTLESWGALNPMVAERTQFAMTVKNDTVYVVGGDPVVGLGSTEAGMVEEYDIVGTTWSYPASGASVSDIAPDPYIGILAPCWENVNGQIVLAGGAYDVDLLENKVYIYSDTSGTFLHVGEVVLPRILFASASVGDSIYLFGGIALSDADPPIPYLTPTAEKGTL
jgi:N-acetylneuraminic acid mutarotase